MALDPAPRRSVVARLAGFEARWGVAVLAAVVGTVAIAAWDLGDVAMRRPGRVGVAAGAFGLFVAALGAGGALAVPFLVTRAELARLAGPGRLRAAFLGAVDGALFYWLAVHKQDPVGLAPTARVVVLVVLASGGAAAGAIAFGRARLETSAAAVLLAGAAAANGLLLPRVHYDWTHLALDLVMIAAGGRLLRGAFARAPRAAGPVALFLVAAAFGAAQPLFARSEEARALLHLRSLHVRGFVLPFHRLADRDRDGASNLFGGRDCRPGDPKAFPGATEKPADGIDQNCEGRDGIPPATRPALPVAAPSPRPDVLLFSVDSLRWDLANELPRLARVLGPHVAFQRAVAPSPRTMDSLSATLRGRAVRQIQLSRRPGVQAKAPWRDPSPTLAAVLARAGYHVLEVPTHRYIDPLAAIFGAAYVAVRPEVRELAMGQRRPSGALPIVRATDALAIIRREAARSREPFAAWVHLMETHEPYQWGQDGIGPSSLVGLRRAARGLDGTVADAVSEVRRLRGRPPVVVLWGDHGEEFGEHGGSHHGGSVHSEQVRVVFWLAGPGLAAARPEDAVSTAAIPATVLDLCGLAAPATMTEPSLLPPLRGRTPWPPLAVSDLRVGGRRLVGYTDRRHRLIYDPVHEVERLYDADVDPFERTDLSHTRPDALARLRRLARRWDETH